MFDISIIYSLTPGVYIYPNFPLTPPSQIKGYLLKAHADETNLGGYNYAINHVLLEYAKVDALCSKMAKKLSPLI